MNKSQKITVTILLIIFFLFIAVIIQISEASKTFLGLIAFGMYSGIKQMWKKPKEKNNTLEKKDINTDISKK